jgi:hypothetical protein
MNTTQKGNLFEERAYNVLASELANERLWAAPKFARIFRRKGYFSRDRNKKIITDISIELYLKSPSDPSLIWVFECKDYKKERVPVDDVEEFHAKLEQIGQDKTKGTIITNGALEGSAVDYAKAKGIGLIRLLPDDQIQVFIQFSVAQTTMPDKWNAREVGTALRDPNHQSENSFFCRVGWIRVWQLAIIAFPCY